jgi:hypothetical protein
MICQKFSASFDIWTGFMTILFLHVLPVLVVYLSFQFSGNPFDSAVMIAFLLMLGSYCVLFHPRSYTLTPERFAVHRLISDIVIPLSEILTVRRILREDIKLARGTFGFGSISGYFGRYTDPMMGRLRLYATRRDKHVLLETSNERIVITPDNPDEFVEEVLKLQCPVPSDAWR